MESGFSSDEDTSAVESDFPNDEDISAMESDRSLMTESDLSSNSSTQEKLIHFRLGIRYVTARAKTGRHHPNVLFLHVCPTVSDRLFRLLRFLPAAWQTWLESRHPEWFLPVRIIMKREKVSWDDEFDTEKEIYQRLAPIQGTIVPKYYGEVGCRETRRTGRRALILSDVGGIGLDDEAAGHLDVGRLEDMLWQSLLPLAELRVHHDDPKLDNYMLVRDRIVIIDFDSSCIFDDEDAEYMAGCTVSHLHRLYQAAHAPGARLVGLRRRLKDSRHPPLSHDYTKPQVPPGFLEALQATKSSHV